MDYSHIAAIVMIIAGAVAIAVNIITVTTLENNKILAFFILVVIFGGILLFYVLLLKIKSIEKCISGVSDDTNEKGKGKVVIDFIIKNSIFFAFVVFIGVSIAVMLKFVSERVDKIDYLLNESKVPNYESVAEKCRELAEMNGELDRKLDGLNRYVTENYNKDEVMGGLSKIQEEQSRMSKVVEGLVVDVATVKKKASEPQRQIEYRVMQKASAPTDSAVEEKKPTKIDYQKDVNSYILLDNTRIRSGDRFFISEGEQRFIGGTTRVSFNKENGGENISININNRQVNAEIGKDIFFEDVSKRQCAMAYIAKGEYHTKLKQGGYGRSTVYYFITACK